MNKKKKEKEKKTIDIALQTARDFRVSVAAVRSGRLSVISRFWQLTRLDKILLLKSSRFPKNIIFTTIPQRLT